MFQLREYQEKAIEAAAKELAKYSSTVITASVGAGKSLILAGVSKRFVDKSGGRVLIMCHSSDILTQNAEKVRAFGLEDVGIYCAKLGKKETRNKVILASRDSLGRDPNACGKFPLVIIDEAHLLPDKPESMYQRTLASVGYKYLLGLTGSPYRMDNGLIFGKGKPFVSQACSITTAYLQRIGFLVPHTMPKIRPLADMGGVKSKGGDFDTQEMEKRFSTERVVQQAVACWWEHAKDRRCSLFFCCSIEHSKLVAREIAKYTSAVEHIDGEMDSRSRENLIERCRKGRVKAVTNCAVWTTGLDIPMIDCVVFLRATQSTSLWIQMMGRGLRTCPGKDDALLLDFAGNWERFDGVDSPLILRSNAKHDGDSKAIIKELLEGLGVDEESLPGPEKDCPKCEAKCPAGWRVCRHCGHIFISHSSIAQAEVGDGWRIANVLGVFFREHISKAGNACIRATVQLESGKEIEQFFMSDAPPRHAAKNREMMTLLNSNPQRIMFRRNPENKNFWELKKATSSPQ